MKKSAVIINSNTKKSLFVWQLIEAWKSKGMNLKLWTTNKYLTDQAAKQGIAVSRFSLSESRLGALSFWTLPCLRFFYFFKFLVYKYKYKTGKVIFFCWPEMLALSLPARLSGLETVWLVGPDFDIKALRPWHRRSWIRAAKKSRLVCFSHKIKKELKEYLDEDALSVVWPGVNAEDYLYQVNLFNKLANTTESNNKSFTIATYLTDRDSDASEVMLQAVKKCREFVDSIQLIVISDKQSRQRLDWLAKKMNLSQVLWQIESQTPLNKWYLNFNVFLLGTRRPDYESLSIAFGAMLNGLPVIADKEASVVDYFSMSEVGPLVSMNNSDEISQAIISLYQNKELRRQLSKNAKQTATRYFTFKRAAREMEKFI